MSSRSVMENKELKAEADLMIQECHLSELLATYPRWFVGGSYSYDLMCWRDLDVYVLDPQHDLERCFEIAYLCFHILRLRFRPFRKSRFEKGDADRAGHLYVSDIDQRAVVEVFQLRPNG